MVRAKLLTMTAITFTWANADFDRRHSTSEMGHFRPIDDVCATSAFAPIATKLLNNSRGRNGPGTDIGGDMHLIDAWAKLLVM